MEWSSKNRFENWFYNLLRPFPTEAAFRESLGAVYRQAHPLPLGDAETLKLVRQVRKWDGHLVVVVDPQADTPLLEAAALAYTSEAGTRLAVWMHASGTAAFGGRHFVDQMRSLYNWSRYETRRILSTSSIELDMYIDGLARVDAPLWSHKITGLRDALTGYDVNLIVALSPEQAPHAEWPAIRAPVTPYRRPPTEAELSERLAAVPYPHEHTLSTLGWLAEHVAQKRLFFLTDIDADWLRSRISYHLFFVIPLAMLLGLGIGLIIPELGMIMCLAWVAGGLFLNGGGYIAVPEPVHWPLWSPHVADTNPKKTLQHYWLHDLLGFSTYMGLSGIGFGLLALTFLVTTREPLVFSALMGVWGVSLIIVLGFVIVSGGTAQLLKIGLVRLLLNMQGLAPLRLGDFLEHCAEVGLLRRVGAGYLIPERWYDRYNE